MELTENKQQRKVEKKFITETLFKDYEIIAESYISLLTVVKGHK